MKIPQEKCESLKKKKVTSVEKIIIQHLRIITKVRSKMRKHCINSSQASISAENHQQSAIAFIVAFITMKTWTNSPRGAMNSKVNFRGKARKCETAFAPLKERAASVTLTLSGIM